MAQGKVTDFFSTRKRNPGIQPSKRRKVEITSSEVDISTLDRTNSNPYRNLAQESEVENEMSHEDKRKAENTVFSPLQTRASRKAQPVKAIAPVSKATRTRNSKLDPKQKTIGNSFVIPAASENGKGAITLVAETVSSTWDEHDGQQLTPTKEFTEAVLKTRKRSRNEKTTQKSGNDTPEKRQLTKAMQKLESKARKKLHLIQKPIQETNLEETSSKTVDLSTPDTSITKSTLSSTVPEGSTETKNELCMKISPNVSTALSKCKKLQVKKTEGWLSSGKKGISSLPWEETWWKREETPFFPEETRKKLGIKVKKVSVHDMKTSLAKVGNLDDLKNRLAQMKEAREKIQAPKLKKFDQIEVQVDVEKTHKVPAYERFHHLATPAAPTLSLPYKYRLLVEQFRGMDQVVSMLHNRSENCTFSKLKVAVQQLTKRNFEKEHISKIKTVYPEAYELRQEKGLQNIQGFKQPGYQLTVEARLDEDEKNTARQTFKASHLLTRRNVFHNKLIHIVKRHHKDFLSQLSRPLSIPDNKITRWHPKFPLDEVPDVLDSPLPQPPDVQTYQTARDVLESTQGKLTSKVEAALRSTMNDAEKCANTPHATKPTSTPSKPAPHLKGVPLSLLEKIRAKEAANTAAALTRNPKEEKRLVMMKRLPCVMRIIRSHFVTEKKPALPLDSVIARVLDSYKSNIAPGDVEPHIDMCIELLPEWISNVQIKKGKYLKIDKNIDLQQLTDKINNIVKGKK